MEEWQEILGQKRDREGACSYAKSCTLPDGRVSAQPHACRIHLHTSGIVARFPYINIPTR